MYNEHFVAQFDGPSAVLDAERYADQHGYTFCWSWREAFADAGLYPMDGVYHRPAVIEKAMRAREFRDDDAGYLAWLETHPDGYVINIARSHNATEARVHRAGCRTISGQNPHGGAWTGPYVKVCAEHLAGLEQWAIVQVGELIRRCGTCHPDRHAAQPISTKPTTEWAVAGPVSEGRCEVCGPVAGSEVAVLTMDQVSWNASHVAPFEFFGRIPASAMVTTWTAA